MMDQGAYHAEQLALQKDLEAALEHAAALGLSKDELSLLYWATGIKQRKERHEMV